MKKQGLLILIALLFLSKDKAFSQVNKEQDHAKRMEWWTDARFGMFLHWGVYSVLGGEWKGVDYGKDMGVASSEWIYLTADIPKEDYEKVAKSFNPTKYNAEEWVKIAKDAGMKYMVLTSKHHDGFTLFDSKYSPWNVTQATAYKKDIIKQYVDACHKQGMRVGLYFSHEKDWYNSNKIRLDTTPNTSKYIQLVENQLTEILTNYGKIDLLWFDMGIAKHKELNESCVKLVRKYQPECIISSRIGNGLGDYKNLRDRELASPGMGNYLESIMTMRLNWAYDKNDANWKSPDEMIAMISKTACRNSNFLLNIGPQPDGKINKEEKNRLKKIGEWMKINGEAIYQTKGSPFSGEFSWGSITLNGDKIYMHLNGDFLSKPEIEIAGLETPIRTAYLLSSKKKVSFKQNIGQTTANVQLTSEINTGNLPIIVLQLASVPKFNLAKGPTWLPPVERFENRTLVTGVVQQLNSNSFTLKTKDNILNFKVNDAIEYRIKQDDILKVVPNYNLHTNEQYTIVYEGGSRGKEMKIKIILKED